MKFLSFTFALLLAAQLSPASAQMYVGNWSMIGSYGDRDGTGGYEISIGQLKDVVDAGDCSESKLIRNPVTHVPTGAGYYCLIRLHISCDDGKYSLRLFIALPVGDEADIGVKLDGKPSFHLTGKSRDHGADQGFVTPLSSDQLGAISRAETSITFAYQNRSVTFPELGGHKKAFALLATACTN